MSWSPVTMTCFFTGTWPPLPSRRRSGNDVDGRSVEPARIASSSTRRTSSVAVRPRMSLARAVSCTPGQLHHDAVGALLLDHRLGDAELVDAVVQRA